MHILLQKQFTEDKHHNENSLNIPSDGKLSSPIFPDQ